MGNWDYNPDRFTRKNLRLAQRDYHSSGAYFVTIRATPLVSEPIFDIPTLRTILQETWHGLPERFPNVQLDEFVIMPDHIHFIVWLHEHGYQDKPLGSIVGAYKSLTTVSWIHYLKSLGADMKYPCRIWQHNYYERVVRIAELEATRQYIRENPTRAKKHDSHQIPHEM